MPDPDAYRFYGDLAAWWPLISPPEEYAEEAEFAARVLHSASVPVRDVVELGSGGGSNAVHLKRHFAMTLVDLSEQMLAVSRVLNPECTHVHGDMRTLRLETEFDAVFIHDAVEYMTDEQQLAEAMTTAFVHCRPGGVAVFLPDSTRETFEPSSDVGGNDAPDGRGVRFMEWTWDPDPDDTWTLTEYAFLLREPDATVRAVHETHRLGLFGAQRWIELLTATGFRAESLVETTTEERPGRTVFVGHRRM